MHSFYIQMKQRNELSLVYVIRQLEENETVEQAATDRDVAGRADTSREFIAFCVTCIY